MIRRLVSALGAGALIAGILITDVPPARAAAPTPPFTECPAVGADTSCGILIVINPGGSLSTYGDPSQPPYENIEDTLVGVRNSSGATVNFIDLTTTTNAFGFDGDGLCTVTPRPSGCPFGTTGYEGPNTSFSNISTDAHNGRVNFTGGLANGGSRYFSLEDALTAASFNPCSPTFTPSRTVSGKVNGSVTVTSPTVIDGAQISGAVNVQRGADVFIKDSTIGGGLNASGARSVRVTKSTIKGSSTINGSTGFVGIGGEGGCNPATLSGITISSNTGGVALDKNKINGGVTVSSNKASASATTPAGGPVHTEISGNTISGGLSCSGNSPTASNGGVANSVAGGRSGECASRSF